MTLSRHCTLCATAALLAACVQPGPPPMQPVFTSQPTSQAAAPAYPSYVTHESYSSHRTHPPATPPPNTAQWRPTEQPVSEPLAGGGAIRMMTRVSNGIASADLHLVIFDSRQCGIRVIDQPLPNAGGSVISEAMQAQRAVAGVNGGFFTPEFQPLGFMIAGGMSSGRVADTKLLSGMFLSTAGQPHLIWRSEYAGARGVLDLLQAGPRLVDSGSPVAGLSPNAPRTRTFIATDGHHGWMIGVARAASLGDLADMLASPGLIPNLRVIRALNLDGGNSSALWMRTGRGNEISEPGWSTVRNFIAIVPN